MTELETKLLSILKEAREALQFASDSPGGAISDTIWMMHRPETLFDFLDAAIDDVEPAHPSADGWIPWAGGECPVSDGVNVDVRFRYGKIVLKSLADGFRWNHAPGPMAVDPGVDIVAYRIVSTPDSKPSPLGD